MTPTSLPHPSCHMSHSQNFDKVDSFLKSVLKICIFGNLIVGWSDWVVNNGTGILHQIYRFSGGVIIFGGIGFIKVRVSIVWSSQTSKAKVVFGCKPLTFFVKSSSLNIWLGCIRHFLCFASEDFASWKKKHVISSPVNWFIYTRMLE